MVGARLVEDSSVAASSIWSSEGSTFFIRELGPRMAARPEKGKHRVTSLLLSVHLQGSPTFLLWTLGLSNTLLSTLLETQKQQSLGERDWLKGSPP